MKPYEETAHDGKSIAETPRTTGMTVYAAAHKMNEQTMFKKTPALFISLMGSWPVLKTTRLGGVAIGKTKAQLHAIAAGIMKV